MLFSLAEAHDVPDDQEIAGQLELFDERQLALDLAAGGVARQQESGSRQRSVISNGGEYVAKFTLLGCRIPDPIGGQQWKLERAGNLNGSAVASFLLAMKMALQFDINIAGAKNIHQAFNGVTSFFYPAVSQSDRKWPIMAARKTNNPFGMLLQLIFANCAFFLLGAQLHLGNKPAQILITRARRNQQRQPESPATNLRPNMRLQLRLLGRHMKSRRAIDSIAIQQCHRRHIQVSASRHQSLWQRSPFQKAKSRPGVKFDVHTTLCSSI
jgi:hypothetical protein